MKVRVVFSWLLFITGIILLLSALLPPLYWSYWSWLIRPQTLFDPQQVSLFPIPKLLTKNGMFQDIAMSNTTAWFPTASLPPIENTSAKYFQLSFPSLHINDILIQVNTTDLSRHPAHFPGSALPGSLGNAVILGHSALPQFFLLGNNLTVFNPLLKLKIGDSVDINFQNHFLTYRVTKIFEVNPNQVEVLNQPSDKHQLSLITCVPLGTYLRRLVVVGELI
jgi:LPXTG-site transpeptidase (sortase) family protein